MVIGKSPAARVVPANVAVPSALSVKVTPLGSAPVSLRDGVGTPVVVTLKVLAAPFVNVVLFALVITAPAPMATVGSVPASGNGVAYALSEKAVVVHTWLTAVPEMLSLAVVVN